MSITSFPFETQLQIGFRVFGIFLNLGLSEQIVCDDIQYLHLRQKHLLNSIEIALLNLLYLFIKTLDQSCQIKINRRVSEQRRTESDRY